MIRLIIADDHAIVRTGLVALLESDGGIEVVGEANRGTDAVAKTRALRPDIVIMDIMMPEQDGVSATREIKRILPGTKVLILTSSTVTADLAAALEAGADGALTKSTANATLLATIHDLAAGKRVIAPEIAEQIADTPPTPAFTPRQIEILSSMERGLTDRDIACQLGLSRDGVKVHVGVILKKLGAANRTEAVAIALRQHLL